MLKDGFDLMVAKFSHDARQEIQANERQVGEIKRRHVANARLYRTVKFVCLCIALVGVGVGIYFGSDLGSLAGEMSFSRAADPTLRPPPPSKAKQMRKLSEMRKQRDADLDEIE